MPNYNPALTRDLAVGQTIVVADSTLLTPFTSQAIAIGREPESSSFITVYNPSSIVATVQAAPVDVDASYQSYSTAPAGTVTQIAVTAQFVRLSFASAPSAAVTISR